MFRTHRKSTRGLTVLEVLISVFVLLIGITGVISLFPVGVRLSQMSTDDILSAMTARNALAAVRTQPNLKARLQGNVLGYDSTPGVTVHSVLGITGAVQNLISFSQIQPNIVASGRGLDVSGTDDEDDCALMLMTGGQAIGKLYRLGEDTTGTASSFSDLYCTSTQASLTDFVRDGIAENDTFRLIGSREDDGTWATVPAGFLNQSAGDFVLGPGAAEGYGYLAIVTPVYDVDNSYQVDILVYKAYDQFLPPEGNQPAVICISTVLSGDMLQ